MFSKVLSATVWGIEAYAVEVEVDVSPGMPSFRIVGLPDEAVVESRERVRAALKNAEFEFPPKRITVNLSPGDIKKEGPLFDLPIAIGILKSTKQIKDFEIDKYMFAGELSLDGNIKPIKGSLSLAILARKLNKALIIPKDNAKESSIIESIDVYPISSLNELFSFLSGNITIEKFKIELNTILNNNAKYEVDFSEVKGQRHAKRALEISAAGGHNIIMIGPPGSGKSMLAQRVSSILPPLTVEEAIEITRIHSIKGLLREKGIIATRPFRAPHSSSSLVSLIGGGRVPMPGEISLSHHGILFLDEIPEFKRDVLEALRQPLEDECVTISRANYTVKFPSSFILIAAGNPCPCGYYGDPVKACTCTPSQIIRYRAKLSGPLMDRIDIHIDVPRLEYKDMISKELKEESSSAIRERVIIVREIQRERYKGLRIHLNSQLKGKLLRKYCKLTPSAELLLRESFDKLGLSGRAYSSILRVARTISDLSHKEFLDEYDISEAIQYRSLDKDIIF